MEVILDWFKTLLFGFANASDWLTKPFFSINGVSYYPLFLLTFTGLTAFIAVAVIKWMVS